MAELRNKTHAARKRQVPEWVELFPGLQNVDDPVWVAIANRAKELVLPAGQVVFQEGDPCKQYIFVLEGLVRVYKVFESGREMVLYRLGPGETCTLTTSVLLAGGTYSANAVTEKETRVALLSDKEFFKAYDLSKGFRDFVGSTFGGRVRELIMLIESVCMRHVDVRLARWLLDNKGGNDSIEASHRELAFELGTAREVISRHLKDFEARGWVRLSRKQIELINATEMQELVDGRRC